MPPQGMFAQMSQAGQQPPMGMPQGMPPQGMPQGMPPQGQPGQPPMSPGAQGLPPQIQQLLQMIAQQGRGGDTLLAHLTPGEIAVPPQVQTPKVLAMLKKDFQSKGVNPAQFTAGSPQSSKNPSTGLPEYNFMSAFLPAALGMAGAAAAPFTGGASLVGSEALAAAIGGGLGSATGGLLTGQTPTQAALSGIGSAAGGYALSGLGGAVGGATSGGGAALTPAQQAILSAKDPAAAMAAGGQMGLNVSSPAASQGVMSGAAQRAAESAGAFTPTPALSNGWGMLPAATINTNPMGMAGSALGGYVGGQLGAPPKSNPPNLPPGFNTPMTPTASLPSAQTLLGQNTSRQPVPNFNGFNPATNSPGAYNFYPTANSGV